MKEEWREKISLALKGRVFTKEHREKLSKARLGMKFSLKTRKRISEGHLGQKAWNKGIPMSESAKRKMVYKLKGVPSKNKGKTFEEMFGKDRALEIRRKMSIERTGRGVSSATKKKLSERNKGKKISDTQKEQIRRALTGRKRPPEVCAKISAMLKGQLAWNKGKKMSPEFCRKMSILHKGRKLTREQREKRLLTRKLGAEHHCWRGGITPKMLQIRHSLELKLWREDIFKGDNYTCQKCGKRGVYIEADHIKPFAMYEELRFDLNNGQTLCKACHKIKTKVDIQSIAKKNKELKIFSKR